MYSYGPPHIAVQKQDDQHEHTFSSYVRIRDVVLKTYLGRWTIGRSGERGSGISVLPARYDDDDDIKMDLVLNNPQGLICHKTQQTKQTFCIQFIMSNSSIWPIDRTQSSATTPGWSGPGSDDNEGVLRISQSSSITGASPSDGLVSYQDFP